MAKSAKTKLTMDFPGLEEYAYKLEKLGKDLKKIAGEALKESAQYVTDNLERDIKPHKRTGATEKSLIKNAPVEWSGMRASIDVGFDIINGGLPSIFLMHGAKPHSPRGKNQPGRSRTPQDKKLYDDVYGSKTKKKIKEIQENVFAKAIDKAME